MKKRKPVKSGSYIGTVNKPLLEISPRGELIINCNVILNGGLGFGGEIKVGRKKRKKAKK